MAAGLAAFALMCLFWVPFALVLNPVLPAHAGKRVGRGVTAAGFRAYLWFLATFCGFRFDLAALETLRGAGPLIVVSNHPSLLDAVMIASRLPNAVFMIKAALMDNVLYGAAARLARYIRNDNLMDIAVRTREEMRGDSHLVVFPEGTRTVRFPLNPCLPSAALISKSTGAPIQALIIDCTAPYLGKAWPLFRPPPLPLCFRIRLGQRFDPPQDVAACTAELEQYLRSELAHASPPH